MRFRSLLRVAPLVLGFLAAPLSAQGPNLDAAVRFRDIGPTRQGGRFVEFAVVESKPQIFYAASASGGLWKTINNGISYENVFENQPISSIGAVAVSQSNPNVLYVGSGEGNNSRSVYYGDGVYKSTDAGKTWTNVGLRNSGHIGRIVVDPTNPNIVFVAALGHLYGENPDRGLYRSIDGGTTWVKTLDHKVDGRAIGVVDVVMDPSNPKVLYAGTYDKVRHAWSFGEGGPGSRLFKSVDGGATWTMLTNGLSTGLLGRIGISIARSDPKTVYAVIENANSRTMPEAQRKACLALGFGDGSIGDELFRTDDAGKTWRKVAPNDAAPAAPQDDSSAAPSGGGCGGRGGRGAGGAAAAPPAGGAAGAAGAAGAGRGAAGGAAGAAGGGGRAGRGGAGGRGAAVAGDTSAAGRGGAGGAGAGGGGGGRGASFGANPPYYYGQIRVDPKNKEHIYLLSVGVTHSLDGGKTWVGAPLNGGDNHALWIDPKDTEHMLLGYDHGMFVTFDGGAHTLHADNLPTAQFYAIAYDNDYPYNVYGGLQDNGSKKGPSTRRGGGNIPYEAWYNTGGGDGMYNVVDWKDSRWLYNESQFGPLTRVDQVTGENKSIRYTRPQGDTRPILRWNWASPILVSPHNSDVIYHAANVLLRSSFRGETWQEISPDLTVNDPARAGGSGNIQYATISTIDESPIVAGELWVGTDDGNVQVTRNGGATWTNVREKISGFPAGYWVSRVAASHYDAGIAYVSVSGYRNDDFKPYLWKTTDFGATWTSIAGNLPQEPINVIREDHKNPNLLFVGTDLGVYASINGGQSWTHMKNNLPTTPIHDLQIHQRENELIVGTHGHGAYIADITGLQGLTPQALASDAALMEIQPVVQWVSVPQTLTASINYAGQSRPAGVAINYFLKNTVSGGVNVRVFDGGRVIAEVTGPGNAGVQTVRWSMQERREVSDAESAGRGGGRGGRGGGGGGGAPGGGRGGRGGGGGGGVVFPVAGAGNVALTTVTPGSYRVVLKVGDKEYSQTATILADQWYKKD